VTQKKLQKGSVYEQADLDGDGEITDREMSLHKELVHLENVDKMMDQHRAMAWVAMGSVCLAVTALFTPLIPLERLESISGFLNTFLVAQSGIVATFFGFSTWGKTRNGANGK
tara:strand:+ start:3280 stop:3618 length:339 start_codon:yes stop_codon:yes gene_type:complete